MIFFKYNKMHSSKKLKTKLSVSYFPIFSNKDLIINIFDLIVLCYIILRLLTIQYDHLTWLIYFDLLLISSDE